MKAAKDSAEWVKKIIDSCQNGFHLECARKLIECFKERYGEGAEHNEIMEAMVKKEPMITII